MEQSFIEKVQTIAENEQIIHEQIEEIYATKDEIKGEIHIWQPNIRYQVGDYRLEPEGFDDNTFQVYNIYECTKDHISVPSTKYDKNYWGNKRVLRIQNAVCDGNGERIDTTYVKDEQLKKSAVSTVINYNLPPNRVLITNINGKISEADDPTVAELSYLSGVTSNIQTQLNEAKNKILSGDLTLDELNSSTDPTIVDALPGTLYISIVE